MSTKQPNSHHCFVCGLQNPVGLRLAFYETGPGEVEATYTAPEHFQGFPGVLHGGIVAALLDEAAGRAPMVGDPNHFMMTAKLEVKYRQPTPLGVPLRVVGRVVRQRGRLAVTHAALVLPDGTITAEAEATLADLPAGYDPGGTLEALGWRVYPDAEPAA